MTTYTHQTAPTQFVEARGNPFRLSPFRQSPRRAARGPGVAEATIP
jgi:hypothetical protein